MKIRPFHYILCTFAAMHVFFAPAYGAGIMSQYGQIQNVQNYSSNPFWSPDGPYNQRMPAPVYVTGPDVKDADCQTVVAALVAAQCVARNNCANTQLIDIRPALMMDLSRLPGHNFASACAGYIDGAFNDFKNNNANALAPTTFPTDAQPATNTQAPTFNLKNPYAPQTPKWQSEMQERDQELKRLQAINNAGGERVAKANFPKTINDVSLEDRTKNLAAGYAPYKDAKAYMGIKLKDAEPTLAYTDFNIDFTNCCSTGDVTITIGDGQQAIEDVENDEESEPITDSDDAEIDENNDNEEYGVCDDYCTTCSVEAVKAYIQKKWDIGYLLDQLKNNTFTADQLLMDFFKSNECCYNEIKTGEFYHENEKCLSLHITATDSSGANYDYQAGITPNEAKQRLN